MVVDLLEIGTKGRDNVLPAFRLDRSSRASPEIHGDDRVPAEIRRLIQPCNGRIHPAPAAVFSPLALVRV